MHRSARSVRLVSTRAASLFSSRASLHSSVRVLDASPAPTPTPSAQEKALRDGLKTAMKSKDRAASTCLKAILADVTNAAKSGPDPSAPASSSAVLTALRRGIDKRRDAAESYAPSSPSAHAEQHAALQSEIALLSSFLPAAPSGAALETAVNDALDALSAEARAAKGAVGTAMKAVLQGLGEGAMGVDRKEVGRLISEGLKRLNA